MDNQGVLSGGGIGWDMSYRRGMPPFVLIK
jgi:hypothetical protein